MRPEQRLDLLIKSGRRALESGFDESTLKLWQKKAYECVVDLLGKDHTYSEHFRMKLNEMNESSLLTGVGVLTAAALGHSQRKASLSTNRDYKVYAPLRHSETSDSRKETFNHVEMADQDAGESSQQVWDRGFVR